MFQRIQSLYIILAIATMVIFYNKTLYNGTGEAQDTGPNTTISLQSNSVSINNPQSGAVVKDSTVNILFYLNLATTVLTVAALFMFRTRMRQLLLLYFIAFLGLIMQILVIFLIGKYKGKFISITEGSFGYAAFLPVVIIVLLVLATLGIRRDERLVRNASRLR